MWNFLFYPCTANKRRSPTPNFNGWTIALILLVHNWYNDEIEIHVSAQQRDDILLFEAFIFTFFFFEFDNLIAVAQWLGNTGLYSGMQIYTIPIIQCSTGLLKGIVQN